MQPEGICNINDYCYILKFNKFYILNLYDEAYYAYTDKIMKIEPVIDYAANEIAIDKDVLDIFKPFIESYIPERKPSHLRLCDIFHRCKPECVANYNVTDYIRLYNFDVSYNDEKHSILDYNIQYELDLMRYVDPSYTGMIIENIVYGFIKNPAIRHGALMHEVIRNVKEHQELFNSICNMRKVNAIKELCFKYPIVFNYCRDIVKSMNIKTVSCDFDNGYLTITDQYALRSSPDLVVNDSEIYDIKVSCKKFNGIQQLYLYARGYEQNYGKVTRCGIMNLYYNEVTFVTFNDLHMKMEI